MEFLGKANLHQLNLERIAFRMQDAEFFKKVIGLLSARHVYQHTLWSYSLKHNQVPAVREFLQHNAELVAVGEYLESPVLTIDPVARRTFEHLEYLPLVNARTHPLGRAGRFSMIASTNNITA